MIILTTVTSITYANDSIDFFASNNTGIINPQQAFQRLTGEQQSQLINASIDVFQKDHLEQGKFENILGTYEMQNAKITGDNSEKYSTSPYQTLNAQQAFNVAHQLAISLNQESVAVFIPSSKSKIGEVTINVNNQNLNIDEITQVIKTKLPSQYADAFSVSLKNSNDFNHDDVTQIEWLGNNINVNILKQAFPNSEVSYKNGNAYLVYKDGHVETIK